MATRGSGGIGRRTERMPGLSLIGSKAHPGSNPGFSTKLVRVMSLIIIVVFYFVFVHGCMVRENSAP